jgi:putative protein-disulfide isomerase
MTSIVHYVYDPMCSWCWGFKPTIESLTRQLPSSVSINRVLGGLAPDSDEPMPEAMQHMLQQTWQQIKTAIPGTEFNFDFWTKNQPRRSTYPACRAILAAKRQNTDLEVPMIEAIQQAYYLDAKNPSDTDVLVSLADAIGCDTIQFSSDLHSDANRRSLNDDINFARQMGVRGFPSVILQFSDTQAASIAISYTDASAMLEQIEQLHVA